MEDFEIPPWLLAVGAVGLLWRGISDWINYSQYSGDVPFAMWVMPTLSIVAGLILALLLVLWWFVFRPRQKRVERTEALPEPFSIVIFRGDMVAAFPSWLEKNDVTIPERKEQKDHYSEIISAMWRQNASWEPNRLWVAMYRAGSHTVVADAKFARSVPDGGTLKWWERNPEQALPGALRFADQMFIAFCQEADTRATVAVWDRNTSSAILRDVSSAGVECEAIVVAGEGRNWTPHKDFGPIELDSIAEPALRNSPNHEGLIEALRARGIKTDALFGRVDAQLLKLDLRGSDFAPQDSALEDVTAVTYSPETGVPIE